MSGLRFESTPRSSKKNVVGAFLFSQLMGFLVTSEGHAAESTPDESASPAPSTETQVKSGEAQDPKNQDDGAFDISSFLDEKFGFLPIVSLITEPAVGFGAAGGLLFISKPLERQTV